MKIKKSGKKIFGAIFSAAEKKAMQMEIMRQTAEHDRKNQLELCATVLWVLHEEFGWGPGRLKKFFDIFDPSVDALLDRYEMGEEDGDKLWLCTYKLKQAGVDVEKWFEERRE